jgi:transposase
MSDKRTRRHFSPQEKVAVLKRHLLEKIPVSNLCDELDIYPTQFYGWLKEFFENGHVAFDNGRKSKAEEDTKDRKIEQLQAKMQRKDSVLAELMEEHTLLKKNLGEI